MATNPRSATDPRSATALGPSDFAIRCPPFGPLATRLLQHTALVVAGVPHRLEEIEFYLHGAEHPDPFAHGHEVQRTTGRWYFHREGPSYRGGSFKGLDITLGPDDTLGGILIRTISGPDGTQINGCSLCVDHLLEATGTATVAELDAQVGPLAVDDSTSAVHLAPAPPRTTPVVATARVGLTLKTLARNPTMPRYILSPYRFVADPTIKKGKVHTVIALHQQGWDAAQISTATRSPGRIVARHVEAYASGRTIEGFTSFGGRALKTEDLCRLHGAWHGAYGG